MHPLRKFLLGSWHLPTSAGPDSWGQGRQRLWLAAVLFFLLLGIFFRVYDVGGRNLWTDEAWVALAATQPTPAAVLAGGKSTPPFYLLTVWGVVQIAGASETALRLTSVGLGLGSLLLFWPLAQRLLPPVPALCTLALVSLSHRLVYFAKELKQYSADIFWAVLVFWLVERQISRRGQGGWLLFILLLALGLGFSYPLVFFLPVAAGILWWQLPSARRAVAFSFGTLALVFLGLYVSCFRGQVDPELLIYWQADFPATGSPGAFLAWLGAAWLRFGQYFYAHWRVVPGAGFAALGLIYCARNGRQRVVWYFCGPLLLALAAAFAHRYPFMGHAGGVRLMMFAAPMLYLVTGAGLGVLMVWTWKRLAAGQADSSGGEPESGAGPRRWRPGVVLLAIIGICTMIVWLRPLFLWQENLQPTANREEIAPLIRFLETHRQPGDAIYLYYFSIDPFSFYYQGPMTDIIWGQSCHDCGLPLTAARLAQIQRLWLVFSHFETPADVDRFVAHLLGNGWIRDFSLAQPGALLLRYRPPWTTTPAAPDTLKPPAP